MRRSAIGRQAGNFLSESNRVFSEVVRGQTGTCRRIPAIKLRPVTGWRSGYVELATSAGNLPTRNLKLLRHLVERLPPDVLKQLFF